VTFGTGHSAKNSSSHVFNEETERAETYLLPGPSHMVVMMEAATPLTNVRYTLNTGGTIVGYEQTMNNSRPTRLNNRTQIKGLYLASAWFFPGGGYEAVLLGGKYAFKKKIASTGTPVHWQSRNGISWR